MWKVLIPNCGGSLPKMVGMWVNASDAVRAVNRAREILVKDFGIISPALGRAKWCAASGEEGTCDGGVYAEGWGAVGELERSSFTRKEIGILYAQFRGSGSYVFPDWVRGVGSTWFEVNFGCGTNSSLSNQFNFNLQKELLFGVLPELKQFEGGFLLPAGELVFQGDVERARVWAVSGLLSLKREDIYWTRYRAA